MKFKLFSFLKENNILVVVKTKLLKVLAEKEEPLKEKVQIAIQEKSPKVKVKLIDFIMDNIELPFYLKMFKGLVKKNIDKNYDKVIDFILKKLDE